VRVSLGTASLLSDPAELIVPLPGQPGSKKWQFSYGLGIHTTPALARDGTIYVAANGSLLALSPLGTQYWTLPVPLLYGTPTVSPEGRIYVGGESDLFYAINPNGTPGWSLSLPEASDY
jgi:outer membrane protein assembly factor BamB